MCWFVAILLFKQKTAYEMRISDWSSDVGSSDRPRFQASIVSRTRSVAGVERPLCDSRLIFWHLPVRPNRFLGRAQVLGRNLDRTSVVSGKSVSVRVDLGGCRFIHKYNIIPQRYTQPSTQQTD